MPTLPDEQTAVGEDSSAPYTPGDGISHSGIALQAQDTGRVLLLQRSLADTEDPNAGLWEFPGGSLEDGEDPYAGACREFGEEVGVPVPNEAENGGTFWDLPQDNPIYRLHLVTVPSEDSIDLNSNDVQNPDDPNGLNPESVAFWDPNHIQGDHIRPEVQDTMTTPAGDALKKNPALVAAAPAPPFTKKTGAAPVPKPKAATPAAPDAEEASEGKVLDLLKQAGDMATDPALKKLLSQATDLLAPPVAAASSPAPPSPAPAPTAGDTPPGELDGGEMLTEVTDLLHQVVAAMAEPNADPAAVSDLVTSALEILDPQGGPATEADALTASAAPVAPPDEWFEPFDLDGPTPLTITADGRVFGHLTTWDSCHRGGQYSDRCQRPPSDPKAPFFHLGQVMTASGNMIDTGVITVGGGHWTKNGLMTTLEHHDDVTAAAATVVVKEDEYGIGLFGSVTPDATPQMVAALRRSPVSGAWRKEKGVHRLKGVHAVNDPGYPVPRSLVASADGMDIVVVDRVPPKEPVIDLSAAARRLARAAGLDTDSMVASARAAMADIDCGCDDDLVASVIGDTSLPVASYDMAWDGGEAGARVFDHFTDASGKVDTEGVAKAYLWRDESHPADQKSGYALPFADIIDGQLQVVPSGVQACAGGHGVGQLQGVSEQEVAEIKGKIGELYKAIQAKYPDAPSNPYDKTGS